jgi:hypothetical protein
MKLFPPFLCLRIYHTKYNNWYCKKFKFCTYWNEHLRTKTFQRKNITSLLAFSNSTSKSPYNVDHNIYNTRLRAPTSPPCPAPPCNCPDPAPPSCLVKKIKKNYEQWSQNGRAQKTRDTGIPRVGASFSRARSKNDRSTSRGGGALRR